MKYKVLIAIGFGGINRWIIVTANSEQEAVDKAHKIDPEWNVIKVLLISE